MALDWGQFVERGLRAARRDATRAAHDLAPTTGKAARAAKLVREAAGHGAKASSHALAAADVLGRDALLASSQRQVQRALKRDLARASEAGRVSPMDMRALLQGKVPGSPPGAVTPVVKAISSKPKPPFIPGPGDLVGADLPTITTQIKANTLKATPLGTQVKALPVPGQAKDVTYLNLGAYNNNLDETRLPHLNELENTGSSSKVNVLSLSDGAGTNDSVMHYIRRDADGKTVTSPYVSVGANGKVDMSDPAVIGSAVKTAHDQYPSKLLWINDNDHGAGAFGINVNGPTSKVGQNDPTAAAMLAANGGKKVGVISEDACLEGNLETLHAYKDAGSVFVGSEDETFPFGFHQDQVLAAVEKGDVPADPKAIALELLKRAQMTGADVVVDPAAQGAQKAAYHLAAYNLEQVAPVSSAVDNLAQALIAANPTQGKQIYAALNATQPFYVASHGGFDWHQRDLGQIVGQLQTINDDKVKQAAAAVQALIKENPSGLVMKTQQVAEEAGAASGVSIYMPLDGKVDPTYLATSFAKDTHWDEFLSQLQAFAPAAPSA